MSYNEAPEEYPDDTRPAVGASELKALLDGTPTACPECQSREIGRSHHRPTFAVPECDFWECEECDHQWGHE